MNRRDLLLLFAGTAAIPDQLLAIGRTVHKRVRAGAQRTFSPHETETVATIAELIIPKTDTPGARDAGVPAFIDVMFTDWAADDQRQMFMADWPTSTSGRARRAWRRRPVRILRSPTWP
ncbi:MAG TPA: gluconate 2-dehydrogenase subunit 3 family protein [Gemmatimonadales bacterium]|nr:gluconate 2-dehydrogenase subunit 3 family protein [Gemmatimonadales bacterium]